MIVFFRPVNALFPHAERREIYPNSLLIILCHGVPANRQQIEAPRTLALATAAFGMIIAVSLPPRPRADGVRRPAERRRGRARRRARRPGGGGAVLAPARGGAAPSQPPISGSISSPPGSSMSARATGVTPFIVIGFDRAGEPLFVWPFGRATQGPAHARPLPRLQARQLQYRGVAARRVAAIAERDSARHLRPRCHEHRAGVVDLVVLLNQPRAGTGLPIRSPCCRISLRSTQASG